MIRDCVSFFTNPTGDANNKKMSAFGLALAADSMAQACLFEFEIVF